VKVAGLTSGSKCGSIASLVVTILLAACGPFRYTAKEFSGRVVGISDGDTITLMHDGAGEKIRLHGIDCPEGGQAFGNRAKQLTSEIAFGETVRVVPTDRDQYGRTVADVYLSDGRMLNQELVRAGLAWWYEKYAPHDKVLRRLREEARAAKRGLWADPHAMPPWEWRAQKLQ